MFVDEQLKQKILHQALKLNKILWKISNQRYYIRRLNLTNLCGGRAETKYII